MSNISNVGLKKPITVRTAQPADGTLYDLACGEGRLEAYIALGQTEIPAIVTEATEEDCFLMSLVENLARRPHAIPLELVRAIGALRERGYGFPNAARKSSSPRFERGVIPHSIAMEIARAKEGEVQQALAQAYEEKKIPATRCWRSGKIIEQRNNSGKQLHSRGRRVARARTVTAESLIRAYQRETERQKLLRQTGVARPEPVAVRRQCPAALAGGRAFRGAVARGGFERIASRARRAHRTGGAGMSEGVKIAFERRIISFPVDMPTEFCQRVCALATMAVVEPVPAAEP